MSLRRIALGALVAGAEYESSLVKSTPDGTHHRSRTLSALLILWRAFAYSRDSSAHAHAYESAREFKNDLVIMAESLCANRASDWSN